MYTNARYICYQCPTASKNPDPVFGIAPGTITGTLPNLSGNAALNQFPDALTRVQRFMLALQKAKSEINTRYPREQDVLKVFVAPEFFFRPKNTFQYYDSFLHETVELNNMYTEEEFEAIKETLTHTIGGTATNKPYADWLVFAGTVVWRKEITDTQNLSQNDDAGKRYQVSNTCIWIYGGKVVLGTEAAASFEVHKAIASTIDGVPSYSNVTLVRNQLVDLKKHFKTISGMRIGLEICLEHSEYQRNERGGVLRRGLGSDKRLQRLGDGLHIQVLIAAGMPMKGPSLACREGGVFMRNDGLTEINPRDCQVIESKVEFSSGATPQKHEEYVKVRSEIPRAFYLPLDADHDTETAANHWGAMAQALFIYPKLKIA